MSKWKVAPHYKPSSIVDYDVPINISVREHGVVERHCKHGIGHPVGHIREWKDWMSVHGCDGCCSQWSKDGDW